MTDQRITDREAAVQKFKNSPRDESVPPPTWLRYNDVCHYRPYPNGRRGEMVRPNAVAWAIHDVENGIVEIKAPVSDAPRLAPGDHVHFRFGGESRKGILLTLFDNGQHGQWCRAWVPEKKTGPRLQDQEGGEYSFPATEATRIPGPREEIFQSKCEVSDGRKALAEARRGW